MSLKFSRIGFMVLLLGTLLLNACVPSTTTPASVNPVTPTSQKTYRMLIVEAQTGEPYDPARQALLASLATFGYVEGKNLTLTHHIIGNDKAKAIEVLQTELKNNYDVVLIQGSVVATAAYEVATNFPQSKIIFTCVTDPVGVGLIADFVNPPQGNFTGVSYPVPVKSRFHFIRTLLPEVKTIGLIYSDMPQGHSYKTWVDDLVKNDPDFKDLKVLYRMVPLVTGNDGVKQMAAAAQQYVQELDPLVDVFVAPNDQLATSPYFSQMVYQLSTKPLVGTVQNDVMQGWGATMAIYPTNAGQGKQAAAMIKRVFEGAAIKDIIPETSKENGYAFDLTKAKQFGIQVPVDMINLAGENIVH